MSEIYLQVKFKLPMMPNFIRLSTGSNDGTGIDVADMDDQEVERFCQAWTVAFKDHVAKRRKNREALS